MNASVIWTHNDSPMVSAIEGFHCIQIATNQKCCWYTHIMCLRVNQCVVVFSSQLSKSFILAVQCQNHQCAELLITRYGGMVSTYTQVCIYMQVQPTTIITYLKVPIAQHTYI